MSAPYKPDRELREAVIKQIAKVVYDAEKLGLDGWKMAERVFPGTPIEVIAEASCMAWGQQTEEWWRQVEATIDGEVIRKAVVSIASEDP